MAKKPVRQFRFEHDVDEVLIALAEWTGKTRTQVISDLVRVEAKRVLSLGGPPVPGKNDGAVYGAREERARSKPAPVQPEPSEGEPGAEGELDPEAEQASRSKMGEVVERLKETTVVETNNRGGQQRKAKPFQSYPKPPRRGK